MIQAGDIVGHAGKAIADRAKRRDSKTGQRTMRKAVEAFNAIEGTDLTESQGWKFMQILKLARSSQGQFEIDDYVDAAGYAGLAGEAAATENFEPAQLTAADFGMR